MPKRMIPLSSRKRGRWSYLFFRGKIREFVQIAVVAS